jgi:hypothetical protein
MPVIGQNLSPNGDPLRHQDDATVGPSTTAEPVCTEQSSRRFKAEATPARPVL